MSSQAGVYGTCQDHETANWLEEAINTITPWEGAELVVVQEEDLPRPDVLLAFLPWAANEDNDRIRAFIESQNCEISTDAWKILNRIERNIHVELAFTVDDRSLRQLEDRNMTINFQFGIVQLKRKSNTQRRSDALVPSLPLVVNNPPEKGNENAQQMEIDNPEPVPSSSKAKEFRFVTKGSKALTPSMGTSDSQGHSMAQGPQEKECQGSMNGKKSSNHQTKTQMDTSKKGGVTKK